MSHFAQRQDYYGFYLYRQVANKDVRGKMMKMMHGYPPILSTLPRRLIQACHTTVQTDQTRWALALQARSHASKCCYVQLPMPSLLTRDQLT